MEKETLLEEKQPAQDKRAVVIIGRFQPPTIGHYKLINEAKKFIRENKDLSLFSKPIVVIVNGEKTSKDKKQNPLTVDERIYFMENSGRANGVIFLSANNALNAFNEVRKAGYEPTVIGAGSDRATGYLSILDSKFLDKNGNKQKHYVLGGIDTRKELKPSKDSIDGLDKNVQVSKVSGSLARKAAELDYFEEFVEITGLNKNIPAAKKLFKILKDRIGE